MKMHHFAAAAAAVLAVSVAAPAFAQIGSVGAGIGTARFQPTGDEETLWSVSGDVATELSGGLNIQGEANYNDATSGGGSGVWNVGAGLFARNNNFAYGANVYYGDLDGIDLWEGGIFAQMLTENFTGTARAYIGEIEFGGANAEYRGVTGTGVFFLNDNASVNLGLEVVDYETNSTDFGINVGVEWKPMNAPIGAFLTGGFIGDNTLFEVGARATFGAQTLKERSQSGAVRTGNPLFRALGF